MTCRQSHVWHAKPIKNRLNSSRLENFSNRLKNLSSRLKNLSSRLKNLSSRRKNFSQADLRTSQADLRSFSSEQGIREAYWNGTDFLLHFAPMALRGWNRYFEEMGSLVRDISRRAGDASANHSFCEYILDRLEVCIESLSSLVELLSSRPLSVTDEEAEVAIRYSGQLSELLDCMRRLYVEWDGYLDGRHALTVSTSYSVPISQPAGRGRPKFEINKEQIQYLRSMSFSWVQISKLLGVSYMTLYRRRQEYGLSSCAGTRITDADLRTVLQQLRQELPSLGQTLVWGRVRSMGFEVTRKRVRQVMRQDDPIHTALRWQGEVIQRQPYSVAGPNSLWHIGESSSQKVALFVGVVLSRMLNSP